MNLLPTATRRQRRYAGFTLLECMIALTILGMLLACTFNMYLESMQGASRTSAQGSATARAAVALEQVLGDCREGYGLSLPTDTAGFTPPVQGTTAASYLNSDGSAAALQLTAPTTTLETVNTSSAAATQTLSVYNKNSTTTLTLYRSDSAGHPAPNTGEYLWEAGTPPGQAALSAPGLPLAKLGETAAISASMADTVKFVRTPGSSANMPAVEVTLIAADYSAIGGRQSSESTQSSLTGKCVFLRNHL